MTSTPMQKAGKDRPKGWNRPARLLHWTSAILILAMVAFGIYIDEYVSDVYEQLELIQLHKSWGFVAFVLGVLRVAWRLATPTPALPPEMPTWQRAASHTTHVLLYVLILLLPLSGWLLASASDAQELFGVRNEVFGLFALPDPFQPGSDALSRFFGFVHNFSANLLLAIVAVHALAALKHHFVDRDNVLIRMIRRVD